MNIFILHDSNIIRDTLSQKRPSQFVRKLQIRVLLQHSYYLCFRGTIVCAAYFHRHLRCHFIILMIQSMCYFVWNVMCLGCQCQYDEYISRSVSLKGPHRTHNVLRRGQMQLINMDVSQRMSYSKQNEYIFTIICRILAKYLRRKGTVSKTHQATKEKSHL